MSTSRLLGLLVGLLVAGAVACQGNTVPGAAQKGSTVSIPLGNNWEAPPENIGFGGTDHDDPQRGTLIVKLVGSESEPECGGVPCELVTRLTMPASSVMGTSWSVGIMAEQYVVIADVPLDAPDGPWPLEIVNRYYDDVTQTYLERPISINFVGSLEVLPDTAGTGTPTPATFWYEPNAAHFALATNLAIPANRLPFVLDPGIALPGGTHLASTRIEFTYDDTVITPTRVSTMAAYHGTAWMELPAPGQAVIHALSVNPDMALYGVHFHFNLVEPDTTAPGFVRFDPASISIVSVTAEDQLGAPVPTATATIASLQ